MKSDTWAALVRSKQSTCKKKVNKPASGQLDLRPYTISPENTILQLERISKGDDTASSNKRGSAGGSCGEAR